MTLIEMSRWNHCRPTYESIVFVVFVDPTKRHPFKTITVISLYLHNYIIKCDLSAALKRALLTFEKLHVFRETFKRRCFM